MKKIILGLMFIVLFMGVVSAALTDDLLAYYKLDNTVGGVVDATGARNGTNNGATRDVDGIINKSFSFDNVNDGVNLSFGGEINPFSEFGKNFSIVMWVNTSAWEVGDRLMDRFEVGANQFRLAVSVGPELQFIVNIGGSQSVTVAIPDTDTWQMITAIYNSTDLILYVNNTVVGHTVVSGASVATDTTDIWLGTQNDGADDHFNGLIDEVGIWNKSLGQSDVNILFQNGLGFTYPFTQTELITTLNAPANAEITANASLQFDASLQPPSGGELKNATVFIWFNNGTLFNETFNVVTGNVTVNTVFNVTFSSPNLYTWNVFGCSVQPDTGQNCTIGTNRTFTVGAVEIVTSYVNTTETATQTIIENITIVNSSSVSSAILTWNNTEFTGTTSLISGTNFSLLANFDSPFTGTAVINFSWNVTFDNGFSQILPSKPQSMNQLSLQICGGSPNNVPFINFTFRNETVLEENITATIVSSWVYWVSKASLNKTLSYSNAVENRGYAFCLDPASDTLNVNAEINYNNGESQQRKFRLTGSVLTNSTLNRALYLLPTIAGIFQKFSVVTNNGNSLAEVLGTITRSFGGGTITSGIDITDSSGFVSFFLNPDITYNGVFSATGFSDNIFSFVPTSDARTVIMGGGAQNLGNGTEIAQNTSYQIFPRNSTLANNTDYTFGFNVTSGQTVTFISMNITNSSGFQMLFVSNAGAGFISGSLNTGNNSVFIGKFVIQTGGESFSTTKVWTIGQEFIGDYSIYKQFKLFNDYGFRDFWKMIIALGFIFGTLIFLSTKELIETSESKIAVSVLLVWAFSIVGWLDTGIVTASTSPGINTLAQFSSQYGIAIVTTAAGAFFIIRRVFIRRI